MTTIRGCFTAMMTTMTMMTLAAALGGCGEAKEAAAAPATVESHSCTVKVAAKASPVIYEGRAEGPDREKVEEAAWADVCAKLPAALRESCKDESKWSMSISGGSASAGGPTTFSKTITLQEKVEERVFSGEAASQASLDEACAAATLAACKAAGAEGDCVAAGLFEPRGRSSQTTRKAVAAPQ